MVKTSDELYIDTESQQLNELRKLVEQFYTQNHQIKDKESAEQYIEDSKLPDNALYNYVADKFGVSDIPLVEDFEKPDLTGAYTSDTYAAAEKAWKESLNARQKFFLDNFAKVRSAYNGKYLQKAFGLTDIPEFKNQYEKYYDYLHQNNLNYNEDRQWLQNWYEKRLPLIFADSLTDDPKKSQQNVWAYRNLLKNVADITKTMAEVPIYDSLDNWDQLNDIQKNLYLEQIGKFPNTAGYYSNGLLDNIPPYIIINQATPTENPFVPVHELNHATWKNIPRQEFLNETIENTPIKEGDLDPYLDKPEETHSRLMELRKALNLDPIKRDYNQEWLDSEEVQKALKTFQLDRYKNEEILNMLNNWAYNPSSSQSNIYFAKQGIKLNILNY